MYSNHTRYIPRVPTHVYLCIIHCSQENNTEFERQCRKVSAYKNNMTDMQYLGKILSNALPMVVCHDQHTLKQISKYFDAFRTQVKYLCYFSTNVCLRWVDRNNLQATFYPKILKGFGLTRVKPQSAAIVIHKKKKPRTE